MKILYLLIFLFALVSMCTAQSLVTTDSLLNTGTAASATYTAPGTSGPNTLIHPVGQAGKNMWMILSNPWGVTTGSGTIGINYNGSGTVSFTMSLTSGLPTGAVVGFPFVLLGCDQWFGTDNCSNAGGYPVDQPLSFPRTLDSMSSFMVDYNYALTGTITGTRDVDMLFDEWVCRTGVSLPNGPTDCLEVEVLPYYNFAAGHAGTFKRTYSPTVVLNGTVTTLSFDEYVWGQAVLYFPKASNLPGLSSAALRFDMLPFLRQAVVDCNATPGESCNVSSFNFSTLAGMEAGTEFGDSTSQSYTLTFTKMRYEEYGNNRPANVFFLW